MKYFSEKTKKVYDDVEALEAAEKEFDEREAKALALREERKTRAKEVEEAYKHYLELRAKFIEDYKSFHMSITDKDLPKLQSGSVLDLIFDGFLM